MRYVLGSAPVRLDDSGCEDGNGKRAIGNVQEVNSCVIHMEVETGRLRRLYLYEAKRSSHVGQVDLIRRQERLMVHGVRYRTE